MFTFSGDVMTQRRSQGVDWFAHCVSSHRVQERVKSTTVILNWWGRGQVPGCRSRIGCGSRVMIIRRACPRAGAAAPLRASSLCSRSRTARTACRPPPVRWTDRSRRLFPPFGPVLWINRKVRRSVRRSGPTGHPGQRVFWSGGHVDAQR